MNWSRRSFLKSALAGLLAGWLELRAPEMAPAWEPVQDDVPRYIHFRARYQDTSTGEWGQWGEAIIREYPDSPANFAEHLRLGELPPNTQVSVAARHLPAGVDPDFAGADVLRCFDGEGSLADLDLWGGALTPEAVNDAGFGLAVPEGATILSAAARVRA